jgi:DNA-binding NarL/FixJ family response regulator
MLRTLLPERVSTIRVILADDHQMVREGLRLILAKAEHIKVVGEAVNGLSTIELVNEMLPDIVIMDIGMPDLNGVEATRQIKAAQPAVQVIALSAYSDRRYVLRMLEAGAAGYVQKSAAGEELIRAIETVSGGRRFLSQEIASTVVDSYVNRVFPGELSPLSQLGGREREVLQLLAEGGTSKQIAISLHISSRTVETHRRNIMKKLDLHNIAELTKYAIREGLVRLDG